MVIRSSFFFVYEIGTKSRILAAAWARHDIELADYLLNGLRSEKKILSEEETLDDNNNSDKIQTQHTYTFGLVEILKALNLLDSRRKIRALEVSFCI